MAGMRTSLWHSPPLGPSGKSGTEEDSPPARRQGSSPKRFTRTSALVKPQIHHDGGQCCRSFRIGYVRGPVIPSSTTKRFEIPGTSTPPVVAALLVGEIAVSSVAGWFQGQLCRAADFNGQPYDSSRPGDGESDGHIASRRELGAGGQWASDTGPKRVQPLPTVRGSHHRSSGSRTLD